MQEYSFLELDYKNCALEKEVDFWKKQLENPVSGMKKIDQDTFLCQFSEDSKKALAAFICDCDRIAHLSKGEFSLSIHPDTNEASAVILAKEIHLQFPWCAVFSDISLRAKHFHIEPVEENGLQLMIYADRPLEADMIPLAEKNH